MMKLQLTEEMLEACNKVFSHHREITGDPNSPCPRCKLTRLATGEDPCWGHLPGVAFACCGHGTGRGYISFSNGVILRFDNAVEVSCNNGLDPIFKDWY